MRQGFCDAETQALSRPERRQLRKPNTVGILLDRRHDGLASIVFQTLLHLFLNSGGVLEALVPAQRRLQTIIHRRIAQINQSIHPSIHPSCPDVTCGCTQLPPKMAASLLFLCCSSIFVFPRATAVCVCFVSIGHTRGRREKTSLHMYAYGRAPKGLVYTIRM